MCSSLSLRGQQYVRVEMERGEGGYALMRRYGLDKSPCSFAEFYKINNLKYGEALNFGKKYFLPIKVYKYNNSSIRSTLKNFDLVKALEVERYNKWIQTQKLKSTYVDALPSQIEPLDNRVHTNFSQTTAATA